MVIQIQIQDDTWKRLNQLKKPGQTFDDVIKHNLNSKEDEDENNKMVDVEIEESNSGSNSEISNNLKTKKVRSQEEPIPGPASYSKEDFNPGRMLE